MGWLHERYINDRLVSGWLSAFVTFELEELPRPNMRVRTHHKRAMTVFHRSLLRLIVPRPKSQVGVERWPFLVGFASLKENDVFYAVVLAAPEARRRMVTLDEHLNRHRGESESRAGRKAYRAMCLNKVPWDDVLITPREARETFVPDYCLPENNGF